MFGSRKSSWYNVKLLLRRREKRRREEKKDWGLKWADGIDCQLCQLSRHLFSQISRNWECWQLALLYINRLAERAAQAATVDWMRPSICNH